MTSEAPPPASTTPQVNPPTFTSTGSQSTGLGPYVRLRTLKAAELPSHPHLASLQSSGKSPNVKTFVQDVLTEASNFMTAYFPKKFIKAVSGSKSAPPANADVQLTRHDIPTSSIPHHVRPADAGTIAESWFARESLHLNKKAQGTADWEEFESGLYDDHSQHEMEYTPAVFDAHQVLNWDAELGIVEGWDKVGMRIVEMCHNIPPPLNNRVFPTLVITGRSTTATSSPFFLVVQIPVDDISKVEQAMYSNGKHKRSTDSQKKKNVTFGEYVSIERAELIEDGAGIKWQMATASDAKGALPMFVQKKAIPGAILKDVGFFIDWIQKRRS